MRFNELETSQATTDASVIGTDAAGDDTRFPVSDFELSAHAAQTAQELSANIDAETTARADADSALQSAINAEEAARAAAVEAESERAQAAESANTAAINAETTARQNTDNTQFARITAAETAISAETTAREAADAALDTRLQATESALDTLNGSGAGSVTKAVADGIASVVADAPESLDTLKELSDWISGHEDSAASMNSAIQDNAAAISAETAARETADSALQSSMQLSKGVNITLYDSVNSLPQVVDFASGAVVSVGTVAWCVQEKAWRRVTAVDTNSLAITWSDYDPQLTSSSAVPESHASSGTEYGVGTNTKYGHVKLSDALGAGEEKNAASGGTAASSYALTRLQAKMAPKSHASTSTDYGIATTARYGHVKLTNNGGTSYQTQIDNGDITADDVAGIVPSILSQEAAIKTVSAKIDTAAAPKSHASTSQDYGIGTSARYGHVKLTDTPSGGATASDGIALSQKAGTSLYNLILDKNEYQNDRNTELYNQALGWAFSSIDMGNDYVSDNYSGRSISNSMHELWKVTVTSGNGNYWIKNEAAGSACTRICLVFGNNYDDNYCNAYILPYNQTVTVKLALDATNTIVVI